MNSMLKTHKGTERTMKGEDDGTLGDQYEAIRKRYDALDVEMESYLGPDGRFRRLIERHLVYAHPPFISDASERHFRTRMRLNPDTLRELVEAFRGVRHTYAEVYRTLRTFEQQHPEFAK